MATVNSFSNINASLDATETEGLIYMREEEKLAHDVYITLYQQWGLSIFNNIATSEDRHESKIETLLENYQVGDSVGDNPIGVFVNPDLQQLYNNLVAQGSQSLTEALNVGVLIEETDIADLQARIAQTDNADIQRVYEQLLSGSNNHLIAFTSTLTGQASNLYSSNLSINQNQGTNADLLTGYGNRGGANSRYAADFLLNSPNQINDCTVQTIENSYLNLENPNTQNQPIDLSDGGSIRNLSPNPITTDFTSSRDPIATIAIMLNNRNAATLAFDVNF